MDYSYESEHTKFMREFLEKNPHVQEKRIEARSRWWDREQNREEKKRFEESAEPMKPYVYFGGWGNAD
ncbi:MAG: DUF3460 family protein [Nitrosomonas sp.]|uniref:DUF3460 family protein n=1 Tax=Nitrosomonas sp. TaxID=42353 RepID=UPI001DD8F1B7|nr:DUF3460 family protein [Nitrosomonas sp.]MBX9893594.1 DUF3460 family protein [Nitrosomonas sp.]